jgi:hypothetical protein
VLQLSWGPDRKEKNNRKETGQTSCHNGEEYSSISCLVFIAVRGIGNYSAIQREGGWGQIVIKKV